MSGCWRGLVGGVDVDGKWMCEGSGCLKGVDVDVRSECVRGENWEGSGCGSGED